MNTNFFSDLTYFLVNDGSAEMILGGAEALPKNTNFFSDLTYFLVNDGSAEMILGGAEALPKRYKITLMVLSQRKRKRTVSHHHWKDR